MTIDMRPWPRADHEAILQILGGKRSALEFGPGASTLSFFKAKVGIIHSYEHAVEWFDKAKEDLTRLVPEGVEWSIYSYAPVRDGFKSRRARYDIALVDSPKGTRIPAGVPSPRITTLRWALEVADTVLLHDCDRPGERLAIEMCGCEGVPMTDKLWEVRRK